MHIRHTYNYLIPVICVYKIQYLNYYFVSNKSREHEGYHIAVKYDMKSFISTVIFTVLSNGKEKITVILYLKIIDQCSKYQSAQ